MPAVVGGCDVRAVVGGCEVGAAVGGRDVGAVVSPWRAGYQRRCYSAAYRRQQNARRPVWRQRVEPVPDHDVPMVSGSATVSLPTPETGPRGGGEADGVCTGRLNGEKSEREGKRMRRKERGYCWMSADVAPNANVADRRKQRVTLHVRLPSASVDESPRYQPSASVDESPHEQPSASVDESLYT